MFTTTKSLKEILQAAYENSKPQGLGYMHYTPGPLTDLEVELFLSSSKRISNKKESYDFDYIKGRALKFSFEVNEDVVSILPGKQEWYDHSDEQLKLLKTKLDGFFFENPNS